LPPHITAHYIRQSVLCPCGLYLDHHRPADERVAAHAFVGRLLQLGCDHERAVAAALPQVTVPGGPLGKTAGATLRLLREGVERAYHPVLMHHDLVGVPDFLARTDSPSKLGEFPCRPVDVKIARSAGSEHEARRGSPDGPVRAGNEGPSAVAVVSG
jgi:predicted RecB family nuclease